MGNVYRESVSNDDMDVVHSLVPFPFLFTSAICMHTHLRPSYNNESTSLI